MGGNSIMDQQEVFSISTREVADRLKVNARCIRKWIDMYGEYVGYDVNEKGHYLLSEESLERLKEIQEQLQIPNKSMRKLREEMIAEGKLSQPTETYYNQQTFDEMISSMNQMGHMMEELFTRMERMEEHLYGIYDSFEDMEQKMGLVAQDAVSSGEVHKMFDEIRKKQDQLKIELRNVHFTQRLTSATSEQGLLPRRQKKSRFLFFF
jgi:NADH/NAD ratio-sensing transcriptional regulator Rex